MDFTDFTKKYDVFIRSPQTKLVKKLTELNFKISVAESCTGGLVSKIITDVPGASLVFEYGVCTYSDEAKVKILGVEKSLIKKHTAVSREVAASMASGIKRISGSFLSLSVTGYAGSRKERNINKNVGIVFIGACLGNKNYVIDLDFKNEKMVSRSFIRNQSAKHAICIALKLLENYK